MPRFSIERYSPERLHDWEKFVASSKNATFLHTRTFLSHHGDRFSDYSLLIYRNKTLYALLPAAIVGETVVSHPGLTYGGLLLDSHATTPEVLHVFSLIAQFLGQNGIHSLIYKAIPHIYHRIPAEEDLYALYRLGASLYYRNIAEAIPFPATTRLSRIRMQGIKKAINEGVSIKDNTDLNELWQILNRNLRNYHNSSPTHSAAEIEYLAERFPDNIRVVSAHLNGNMIAGAVLFITDRVTHVQYIASTEEGKQLGALDLLFDCLVKRNSFERKWFDFGTCNEDNGRILNASLAYQKEGFGARGICYDAYTLPLDSTPSIPCPTLLKGKPTLI